MSVTLQFTAICMQALLGLDGRRKHLRRTDERWAAGGVVYSVHGFGVRRTESCLCMLIMFHLVWPFLYSYVTCSNPWHKFVRPNVETFAFLRIQGVPNGCRAKAALFVSSTLQNSSKSYPSIGQKKLNGAASRMTLHFAVEFSYEVLQKEPSDLHRRGFKEKWLIESSWFRNFMVFIFSGFTVQQFFSLKRGVPYQVDLGSIQGIGQHGHHFGFAWSWKTTSGSCAASWKRLFVLQGKL